MSGGCPSFQPKTVSDFINEQEFGLVLGEFQLQWIHYKSANNEFDSQRIHTFQSKGGVAPKSTQIPDLGRRSQKRKYADHHFENEEEEQETRPVKISAIAWHPFKPKLAVAVKEYGIYFYNQAKEIWEAESYSDMGPINHIRFCPLGSCLAAATEDGVYVWRSRKDSGTQKYHYPFQSVQGIRFSPCGTYIAAWSKSTLRILRTSKLKESVKLHTTWWSTIKDCDWGPAGLLVSHAKQFFLYDTTTWKYHAYSSIQPLVSTIAGFPSQMFLFGTSRYLQWLMLKDRQEEIGIAFDLAIPGSLPDDMQPKEVVLSPCCSRIAMIYELSECPLSRSVAVIAVEKTMLVPVGFIHGEADWGEALKITFRTLPKGTLLTIFWASGVITFHHLLPK